MFHKVKWQKIETEEAAEKYDIGEASNGSIELDDLGDAPEHFLVHKGNLTLAGNHSYGETLKEDPDGIVVCVVDGDLTFEGNFKFWSADVYHVLLVTGSLTCTSVASTGLSSSRRNCGQSSASRDTRRSSEARASVSTDPAPR